MAEILLMWCKTTIGQSNDEVIKVSHLLVMDITIM